MITSSMEHNSVLRPLRFLEERGIDVTRLACRTDGGLDPSQVEAAILPKTRLIVLGHASNVTGALCPIREIGAVAAGRGILFCVDAAQTAGIYPIDMRALQSQGVDILACGTCLSYFELTDKLAVGRISNMFEIGNALLGAGKLVEL